VTQTLQFLDDFGTASVQPLANLHQRRAPERHDAKRVGATLFQNGIPIEEFVADGVDGLLVADDAEMTEAIVRLVEDRRLLEGILDHNRSTPPPFGWPRVLAAADAEYARATDLAPRVPTA